MADWTTIPGMIELKTDRRIYCVSVASMRANYLIVQVEVVEFPVGPEVLSVSVQGEIDIAPVALDHRRVPVAVIQEAARCH